MYRRTDSFGSNIRRAIKQEDEPMTTGFAGGDPKHRFGLS